MTEKLYREYIDKGFALRLADVDTKKTAHKRAIKGGGCNYVSDPYNKNSRYCAIPTPESHLLIIDVDVKDGKKGMESLQKLADDLHMDIGSMKPAVKSPSGGIHIYCTTKDPVKKDQKKYPDIDFQSFRTDNKCAYYVMAGDQDFNKKRYELLSNEIIINKMPFLSDFLEHMDNKKQLDIDYEVGNETPERAIELLKYIDPCCDEPKWFKVCNILKREVGEDGFEVFDEWSSQCSDKYDKESVIQKWNDAGGEGATFGSLVKMAEDGGYVLPRKNEEFFDNEKSSIKYKKDDFELFVQNEIALDIDDIDRYPLHEVDTLDPSNTSAFLFNRSLTVLHGLPGSGKSELITSLTGDVDRKIIYLDMEHNGGRLKEKCIEAGIQYEFADVDLDVLDSILDKDFDLSEYVIIVDSFDRLIPPKMTRNDGGDTSKVVSKLHDISTKLGATTVLIAHSTGTEKDDDGRPIPEKAKIEGSETGMVRHADFVFNAIPIDMSDLSKGHKLLCEKSRNVAVAVKYKTVLKIGDEEYFQNQEQADVVSQRKKDQAEFERKHSEHIAMMIQAFKDSKDDNEKGFLNEVTIRARVGLPPNTIRQLLQKMTYFVYF